MGTTGMWSPLGTMWRHGTWGPRGYGDHVGTTWGQCEDNVEMAWGQHGDHGDVQTRWGQHGDNMGTMWRQHGDHRDVETMWGQPGDNVGTKGMCKPCGDNMGTT